MNLLTNKANQTKEALKKNNLDLKRQYEELMSELKAGKQKNQTLNQEILKQ